jgi:hypothetical protein
MKGFNSFLPFIIINKHSDTIVGSTRYHNIDYDNHRMEIGHTWIAKSFRRTTVNTEMKFQNFALKDYNITLNNLISQIKDCVKDAYDVLSNYIGYLQSNCNVSAMTLKQRVVTAKNFLEYYDVDKSKEIQAKGKNTQSYKKKQRGIIKRRHSRYFECLP